MKDKFQQLKNENQKRSPIVLNNKRTIMKPAVLNLTGKTIDKNVTSLLNLGLFKIMLKLFVWKQKSSYEKKIKFADAS